MMGSHPNLLILLALGLLFISSLALANPILHAHQGIGNSINHVEGHMGLALVEGRRVALKATRRMGEEKKAMARMGSRELRCGGGKKMEGRLKVECELRGRHVSSRSATSLVGYIPFSSDYHPPKTHPPKHN